MGYHAEMAGLDLHSPSRETIVGGTAGDIAALTCVKVVGMGNFFPKVEPANGDTDLVAGVVVTGVTEDATGSMWTVGRLSNINTSQWSPGTLLWADDSGQLNTSPTDTIVKAVCLDQHSASGAIYLFNTIRSPQYALSGLADVGAITPSAGDVIVFDGAAWSATALSGVAAHFNLSSIADVGAITNSAGDILRYDGATWSATALSGVAALFGISSIANVGALTPTACDFFIFDGTNWSATAVSSIGQYVNLSAVADVVLNSASSNDILVYDSAAGVWSATALSGVAAHFGLSSIANVGTLTPSAGDFLMYDGANWSAAPRSGVGAYFNLSAIADVIGVSGASANDVLTWRASASVWEPKAAAGGGGGGGGSVVLWTDNCGDAPIENFESGFKIRTFEQDLSQVLYGHVVIPDSHVPGEQIHLITSFYATSTGNYLLWAEVDMIRMGQDAISSTANHYSSTNDVIAVSAVRVPYRVTIPLTDCAGQIYGNEVSGSDGVILVLGIKAVGDSADANVYMLPDVMEVKL